MKNTMSDHDPCDQCGRPAGLEVSPEGSRCDFCDDWICQACEYTGEDYAGDVICKKCYAKSVKQDPDEIPDWKYAEEAERRHES